MKEDERKKGGIRVRKCDKEDGQLDFPLFLPSVAKDRGICALLCAKFLPPLLEFESLEAAATAAVATVAHI